MMNKIIKERLALIQSGTIPHGYKKTKAGIMPEDWDGAVRAKDVFKNHTDKKHNGDLEILAATQENGIVPRSQIGIDIQCSEEGVNGYKKVSKGDFVISLRSFQGGIEYSEYDGIVSPAYTVLQPVREISDGYYRNYFKTDSFIQRLNGAVYGIRDGKQIGYQDFGDMYIHCPPIDEQKKIAEILEQCDKIISLKQERLEAELDRKKWLMNQLLHHPDKYRVPGFDGDWKKATIGSITSSFSGGTPTSSNSSYYSDTGIPFIRSGEIGRSTTELYLSDQGFANSAAKMVNKGDLLYALYGANSGECFVSKMDGAINQAILCIRSKTVDIYFLHYVLVSMKEWIVATYLQGGQGNLSGAIIKKLKIAYPQKEEQQAIVKIIHSQDIVIDKIREELKEFKERRKALMQLLLTGIVRVKL